MYVDNTRNRMLIVFLSVFVTVSLSWNIKQLFYVSYYQRLVSDTEEMLSAVINAPVASMIPILSAVTSTATPTPARPVAPVAEPVKHTEPKRSEVQCLAENIYYEASNQSFAGKLAVAHVTVNRMHNPKYPKTICGVVNQRIDGVCMFSWKCEEPRPIRNQRAWKESQQIAYELLSKDRKDIIDITEGATHFHSVRVRPGWKHKRVARIDDHIFYRQ